MSILRNFLLTLLLAGVLPVFAQDEIIEYTLEDSVIVTDERSTDLPAYNLTATKLPVPLLRTPASVSVVKRELLDEGNAQVVGNALNYVSGVNPQTQNGVADFFYIRGFSSLENGLVLVDGTPEPEVSFYNLYNVDRVEVLKGPSTFLYGSNPLAGAVNLVHKKPIFSNFATIGGSFGQFNSARATLDAGFVNNSGQISGRVNGLFQQSDGYRDDKENNAYGVNPVLTFQLDNRSFINLDVEYLRSEYTPDSGIPLAFDLDFNTFQITGVSLPDVDVETNYEVQDDNSEQNIIRGKVDYNRKLSSNLVLRNKFYYSSLDWESAGTLLNGAFFSPQAMASFVDRSFSTLDDKQVWLGNQLELLWTVETGQLRHKLLVGAEVNRLTDVFALEFTGGTSVQLDDASIEVPGQQTGFQQFFQEVDASAVTFAPYILDRIELHPKTELLVGGRLDVLSYEDERTELVFGLTGGRLANFSSERSYTKFNPLVGLVVLPTEEMSLYANFSQAFAPPSTQATVDSARAVNDDFSDPEQSRQVEVGAKYQMADGRLNASIAYYDIQKENIEIPSTVTPGTIALGTQRSKGIEVDIAAKLTDRINLYAAYAYNDAELEDFSESDPLAGGAILDRSGNKAPFAPEHLANLWLSGKLANGIGAGAGVRYLGNQFIAADNSFEVDSYTLLNAAVFYQRGNYRLSVNLNNLTDEAYLTQGVAAFSVIPGRPLEAVASLEIQL